MTSTRVLRALAGVALLGAVPARAQLPPPVPYLAPPPTWCWIEVRLFETLRYGTVDVCRKHLRYRAGALDCYRIIDRVCASVQPTGEVLDARTPTTKDTVPCPHGIEPPMCRRLDID